MEHRTRVFETHFSKCRWTTTNEGLHHDNNSTSTSKLVNSCLLTGGRRNGRSLKIYFFAAPRKGSRTWIDNESNSAPSANLTSSAPAAGPFPISRKVCRFFSEVAPKSFQCIPFGHRGGKKSKSSRRKQHVEKEISRGPIQLSKWCSRCTNNNHSHISTCNSKTTQASVPAGTT